MKSFASKFVSAAERYSPVSRLAARLIRSRTSGLNAPGVTPAGYSSAGIAGRGLVAGGALLGYHVATSENSFVQNEAAKCGEDVYEHRFVTDKANAEDLAEFYGAEDFMEVLGVIPAIAMFFLRKATFDEEGIAHTYGLPVGTLDIELKFTQEEEEDDDGEDENIVAFNKMMKWDNQSPVSDKALWNIRHDFGFRQVEEGVYEICHKGTDYQGPAILKWVWWAHSFYAVKATEIYVNCPEFSEEDSHPREQLRNRMVFRVGKEVVKDAARSLLNKVGLRSSVSNDQTLAM